MGRMGDGEMLASFDIFHWSSFVILFRGGSCYFVDACLAKRKNDPRNHTKGHEQEVSNDQ
jgi:hypothetical protein